MNPGDPICSTSHPAMGANSGASSPLTRPPAASALSREGRGQEQRSRRPPLFLSALSLDGRGRARQCAGEGGAAGSAVRLAGAESRDDPHHASSREEDRGVRARAVRHRDGEGARAGGAEPVVWDDGEKGRAAASRRVSSRWISRRRIGAQFAALVLAPGVPLTHPEPHWTVERRARRRHRGDRRHRAVLPRAARTGLLRQKSWRSPAPTANRRPRRSPRI